MNWVFFICFFFYPDFWLQTLKQALLLIIQQNKDMELNISEKITNDVTNKDKNNEGKTWIFTSHIQAFCWYIHQYSNHQSQINMQGYKLFYKHKANEVKQMVKVKTKKMKVAFDWDNYGGWKEDTPKDTLRCSEKKHRPKLIGNQHICIRFQQLWLLQLM